MICEGWDLAVVPFPFAEMPGTKRRPALVISKKTFNRHGHTVLAMITSASHHPWPGDTVLTDPEAAGLKTSCMVRLKLFTLDNRLVLKRIGRLATVDRENIAKQVVTYLVGL